MHIKLSLKKLYCLRSSPSSVTLTPRISTRYQRTTLIIKYKDIIFRQGLQRRICHMAAFLSATMWQQKLLVIHCISIFIGIPTVTLPSLILGTLSHSASASCQHGTPGKIIEDFWKITRGSRREDLICFYFLCIREFRCLQFACFLTFFCLGVSLHSSVVFHFTALVFLMSLHFTHFLFP